MNKVEGYSGLQKGSYSVVNTDWKAYEKAKERKKEKDKVNQLEQRLERIESLLKELLNR